MRKFSDILYSRFLLTTNNSITVQDTYQTPPRRDSPAFKTQSDTTYPITHYQPVTIASIVFYTHTVTLLGKGFERRSDVLTDCENHSMETTVMHSGAMTVLLMCS